MPLGVVRGAMEQAHRGPNLRDPTAESAGAAPIAGSPPGEPAAEPVAAPSDAGADTTNGSAQGVTAVHCALCDVTLNDRAKYEQHLESKKHKKNAQSAELQALRDEWCRECLLAHGGEEFEGPEGKEVYCHVCGMHLNGREQFIDHVHQKKHSKNLKGAPLRRRPRTQ